LQPGVWFLDSEVAPATERSALLRRQGWTGWLASWRGWVGWWFERPYFGEHFGARRMQRGTCGSRPRPACGHIVFWLLQARVPNSAGITPPSAGGEPRDIIAYCAPCRTGCQELMTGQTGLSLETTSWLPFPGDVLLWLRSRAEETSNAVDLSLSSPYRT